MQIFHIVKVDYIILPTQFTVCELMNFEHAKGFQSV